MLRPKLGMTPLLDGARTSRRSAPPAMATVALELVAAELVNRLPPFSHALGRVTLDLASGMIETHLSQPSNRNSVSTAVLRAPRMAMHAAKLTDATPSPHLHRVASLGHQDGVAILT